MEELIKKMVNLGIGVVKTVENGFHINASDLQGIFNELVEKGEMADDELAIQVKDLVDQWIQVANEGEAQAKQLLDSVTQAISNIDLSNLAQDLRTKVEELLNNVRGSSQG